MAITHIPAEPNTGNLKLHPDLPRLLELYGTASSTPWVEPQYQIFREYPEQEVEEAQEGEQHVPGKGAAQGYLVQDGRAVTWGEVSANWIRKSRWAVLAKAGSLIGKWRLEMEGGAVAINRPDFLC